MVNTVSSLAQALPVPLPLVILTGAFTPVLVLVATAGRLLRRRAQRRRAARVGLFGEREGDRPTRAAGGTGRGRPRGRWRMKARGGVPLLVGALVAALVPGAVGVLGGVLAAVLLLWRGPPVFRSGRAGRASGEPGALVAQLPLTADLLAACLGSSASPAQAAEAVARTIGDPMRTRLAAVSAELALGAPPAQCWQRLGADCPALAPLARCLVRATVSGAPPAAVLAGLAVSQRSAAARAAHTRVRRAGVLATAPLGLCFLPAFVLIGIVPVVTGLAAAFGRRV